MTAPAAPSAPPPRFRLFRWKAVGPLLALFVILGILVVLFAEPVARDTTEEVSTELLGTQVDVGALDLHPRDAAVELRRLQIADPFDSTRNLVEAETIQLELNPEALAEKKVVIERFVLHGMRFGTTRAIPARPVGGDGFAPRTLRAVRQWADQFDVPLLSLTPIDTIRQLVLHPDQLATVQEAQALVTRADSTRQAVARGFQALDVRPPIDSARQLAARLAATDPTSLGVAGVKDAAADVQRGLRSLDDAKRRIDGFERDAREGIQRLESGLRSVDEARRRDYAFAKSLLKLPTFEGPEIGEALFGKVSIDRFQQALYWAELARHYMPPGLLPRETEGPTRLRAAGTTVGFPKAHEFPAFLLELGAIDFAIGGDSPLRGAYEAVVRGVTSTPALYGHPMTISAKRRAGGGGVGTIDVNAVVDHVGEGVRDSAAARIRGLSLPRFVVPGVPFAVTPGTGSVDLAFALRGDQLRGRWAITADRAAWSTDSAARPLTDLERLLWRVVSGLERLEVAAEVTGSVARPRLAVHTNLDDAIAARLRAVVGDEVVKAERMARAKVDSLVADQVAPLEARVAEARTEAMARVETERARLAEARTALEAELKRLAGPAGDIIKLPKIPGLTP